MPVLDSCYVCSLSHWVHILFEVDIYLYIYSHMCHIYMSASVVSNSFYQSMMASLVGTKFLKWVLKCHCRIVFNSHKNSCQQIHLWSSCLTACQILADNKKHHDAAERLPSFYHFHQISFRNYFICKSPSTLV